MRALANGQLDPLFLATVQSVEESIVNAMVAAETMTGFATSVIACGAEAGIERLIPASCRRS